MSSEGPHSDHVRTQEMRSREFVQMSMAAAARRAMRRAMRRARADRFFTRDEIGERLPAFCAQFRW